MRLDENHGFAPGASAPKDLGRCSGSTRSGTAINITGPQTTRVLVSRLQTVCASGVRQELMQISGFKDPVARYATPLPDHGITSSSPGSLSAAAQMTFICFSSSDEEVKEMACLLCASPPNAASTNEPP